MSEANREERNIAGPAIRVVLMPKDTNAHGTIFGGVIRAILTLPQPSKCASTL